MKAIIITAIIVVWFIGAVISTIHHNKKYSSQNSTTLDWTQQKIVLRKFNQEFFRFIKSDAHKMIMDITVDYDGE